ncbi:MAG: hypothetical protein K8S98_08095 [Planctomycetes bacterium]|nr:hypothetical protein [Planctomycetota bacterium]
MRFDVLLPLLALPVLAFAWPEPRPIDALAPERELATFAPADSVVYVEAPGLADLARRGLEHPLVKAVLAAPRVKALLAAKQVDPRGMLSGLDAFAGLEVLPTIALLGARGASVSVAYRREAPSVLLALRGADERVFGERIEELLALIAERSGHPGAFDAPTERVLDAEVWRVGDTWRIARRGALAFASNDERFLRDALELAAKSDARGLAGTAAFAAARKSPPANELVFAFADPTAIDARAEKGLLGDVEGWRNLRGLAREPSVQFLLGPTVAAATGAHGAALSVVCEREDLRFVLTASGVERNAATTLLPEPRAACAPLPTGRVNAASWTLHRDLAELFVRRAELFPAEKLPAFAEALSNLALFFGGVDLSDDVLPAIAPWGRLVVRDVAFDADARPDLPLPAAALVARVADPARISALFPSAFQSVVGVINVERGQQGKPPMPLGIELVGDVQVSFAKSIAPKPGEGVDVVYNLEPACALVGDVFVVGTHRKLVEELVKELRDGRSDASAPNAERLDVAGAAVLAALTANREALVMKAVLGEGKTRAKAESDLDLVFAIAELVQRLSLEARRVDETTFALELSLDLAAPKE